MTVVVAGLLVPEVLVVVVLVVVLVVVVLVVLEDGAGAGFFGALFKLVLLEYFFISFLCSWDCAGKVLEAVLDLWVVVWVGFPLASFLVVVLADCWE